jgi:hypothetical protein
MQFKTVNEVAAYLEGLVGVENSPQNVFQESEVQFTPQLLSPPQIDIQFDVPPCQQFLLQSLLQPDAQQPIWLPPQPQLQSYELPLFQQPQLMPIQPSYLQFLLRQSSPPQLPHTYHPQPLTPPMQSRPVHSQLYQPYQQLELLYQPHLSTSHEDRPPRVDFTALFNKEFQKLLRVDKTTVPK